MFHKGLFSGYAIIQGDSITFASSKIEDLLMEKSQEWLIKLCSGDMPLTTSVSDEITVMMNVIEADLFLAIFQNIRAWENLLQESRDLNFIFKNSHDGIYVTDGKGNTLKVNPGIERNFGVSSSMLIGRNVIDLEKEEVFRPSVARKVLEEKKRVTVYQETKHAKLIATGNPIFNDKKEIIRVICNSRDITELTRLQEELAIKKEEVKKYKNELLKLRERETKIDGFIAKSKKMESIMSMLLPLAHVDSTVLITGESGTGKGVFAKAIHRMSLRNKGPFIKVNCSAIPEHLLESELFGYEPGAFTGAKKEGKPGYFELAHNGTLFLDEIGDLSLTLQAKLLQAIQDKVIQRLGGTTSISVDFRLITATNQDLLEMVELGSFRRDLFYRLHVIPIELPPLRERQEDIPLIIHYFLEKYNKMYQLHKYLDSASITLLCQYHWPGNVRELQNIIERLVVLSKENRIAKSEVLHSLSMVNKKDNDLSSFSVDQGLLTEINSKKNELGYDLSSLLKQIEKQCIEEAMKVCTSTRKAAKYLKMSQPTLIRRLKEYDIQ